MCIEVDHRMVLVHAVDRAVSVLRVGNAISSHVLQHVISLTRLREVVQHVTSGDAAHWVGNAFHSRLCRTPDNASTCLP